MQFYWAQFYFAVPWLLQHEKYFSVRWPRGVCLMKTQNWGTPFERMWMQLARLASWNIAEVWHNCRGLFRPNFPTTSWPHMRMLAVAEWLPKWPAVWTRFECPQDFSPSRTHVRAILTPKLCLYKYKQPALRPNPVRNRARKRCPGQRAKDGHGWVLVGEIEIYIYAAHKFLAFRPVRSAVS